MKSILVALTLILSAAIIPSNLTAQKAVFVNNPVSVAPVGITKQTIDLGEVAQGTPVTATFELKNQSADVLLIKDVKSSCGCTAGSADKAPIGVNEKTTVSGTYDAKKLGAFTKSLKVFTNVQEDPIILHIKGEVVK